MVFRGLKQPEIFTGALENHLKIKYERTRISEEMKRKYREKLIDFMKSEKPYLKSSLSLNDIAEKISVQPHHLSQVLNTCLNQNFFDFINSYRIEESMKMLKDKTSSKMTILEILYETGFNSKSVFNTAFKKYTG